MFEPPSGDLLEGALQGNLRRNLFSHPQGHGVCCAGQLLSGWIAPFDAPEDWVPQILKLRPRAESASAIRPGAQEDKRSLFSSI
jgi:hypothetical protein